jgi:hypothetical protein
MRLNAAMVPHWIASRGRRLEASIPKTIRWTGAGFTRTSWSKYMAKALSQQLADLSVRAKNAEDAITAASKEAHDKVEARKEEARAAAANATAKVKREIESARDTAVRNWTAVRAKIAADIDALKANVAQAKHEVDERHAESRAERLEWEARVSVDYAIAAVEQARLAVLDAVSSRAEAAKAKTS